MSSSKMPFPKELKQWFPDDNQRGRVRALGEDRVNEIIANGQDDVASIPGTLAGHAGLPAITGFLTPVKQSDKFEAFVKVGSPTGHFSGYLLVDTGCDFELNLSEHKAKQIGIWKVLSKSNVETGGTLSIGMTNRTPAVVELFLDDDSVACAANLDCWTDDGTLAPGTLALCYPNPRIKIMARSQCSPVKGGKDRFGHDLILGRTGMEKLGLGVDPKTHRLVKLKRRLRK